MGFRDKIKESLDKTKETIEKVKIEGVNDTVKGMATNAIQTAKDNKLKREEIAGFTQTKFEVVNGSLPTKYMTMYQKPTGEIFFDDNYNSLFCIVDYNWNGPKYKTITNSQTVGTEQKKGKAGKVIGGAALGAMTFNPIGVLVGAGAGAMSKGKKNTHQNTTSTTDEIEVPTPATLKLKNLETHEFKGFMITCNTIIDSQIHKFAFSNDFSTPEPSPRNVVENDSIENAINPYDEVKQLKELLDMDIITQEEFDTKKKQLLGL